ncbi:uncharacterized protein LOC104584501 isoform X2 [Brachypodium distachyon]|uniref:DUF629 domain-containing protein n=1 Tax=Brachypodium distachyon TaxID=15368 RepID=A0A0Q3L5M9_BRADI|nr:uncharacterized protein LOC104584501 isoform X2 [Brachypodium distachyon]KQJ87957.1 hypothetical protein BRADI_4g14570v3 [Brachypodium distachyon]PNT63344.1 hypothetical protein BRADI_4g14570v3 [Brachypodium distachyon]PNT63346.1 hypothetical protein BRADI_4g14570v3 [Brachypodium distachyon]|eukprot:XP_010237576.1 uncharacterized protein LOC104584501 isoform X2 [Brachypodium distachyon]
MDSSPEAAAMQALKLHVDGHHAEALDRAVELAREHPGTLALNFAGYLHQQACANMSPDDEEAITKMAYHMQASLDAFSYCAETVPNCVVTAVNHGKALAARGQFGEAQQELFRALSLTHTDFVDPAVHNVGYDVFNGATVKQRKQHARTIASLVSEELAETICGEVVPREALVLLNRTKLGEDCASAAGLLAETYPYLARAHHLRAYIDLEQVRALDPAKDKKLLLRRTLGLIRDAAKIFNDSLVIALFHAKLLFVLNEFDDAERECRRALSIETPNDPNLDDLPPGAVSGEDMDARVSSVKKQVRVLLKQIVVACAIYWCSMKSTQQGKGVISVSVDTLHQHYDRSDQTAAKTISDAQRFVKKFDSWSFWICPAPDSHCDGKKFMNTDSLWQHMCAKHRDKLWNNLQSILGPELCEITSEDDYSLDGITLCQDSGKRDIFSLPRMQDMFESLLLWPSIGIIAPESIAEMRQRKRREGSEILESIKEKLRTLPADTLSTEFEECCFGVQNLWLKFLEISVVDYREVILPLARSFQWIEMKRCISRNVKGPRTIISNANIDAVFSKIDHQVENLKPSCSDETLMADEKCEESEVDVEDSNSGTLVNQRLSDPPIGIPENGTDLALRMAEVEPDKKGTSDQSFDEMASTSSCQESAIVFNKNGADKDLFNFSFIIQSLCNLRHFRDKFLTEPLVWTPSVDNPCMAQIFYEIFSSWEKNERYLTNILLNYMKTLLCGLADCTSFYEKLQVGKIFASEIVATVLIGLHMSETSSRFSFNKVTERQVVNPNTCGDCICPTHKLFGIKFEAQMSCGCGKCSDGYLYATLFHKLDAGSPQTTKIKSFADLPVLLDEQFCKENNCKDCGNLQAVELSLSNTPHFITIVLNWLGGNESQDTLSEVMDGLTSPLETEFFCRSAHSATMYTVTSMVIKKGGESNELFGIGAICYFFLDWCWMLC